MVHRLQAGPHPDASRAHPVFTACQLCTAGRHQHPAAPSSCDRLFNPQTTQPPPATRARPLPTGCTRPAAGPQQPREGPSRPPAGEPHQGGPAGLPQAAPGPSQGQRRGAWGEPCSLALGGHHHIARPEIDLRPCGRATPGSGGGAAVAVPGEVLGVGEDWGSSCEKTGGSLERNLKGDFEIDSGGRLESGPTCAQVLRSRADKALHHWVCPPQRWVVEPGQHLGVSPVPTP